MDWATHAGLAAKILETCGVYKGVAVYSNPPAIDSKPPEYHRVYAYITENQPPIPDAVIEILGTKATPGHAPQTCETVANHTIAEFVLKSFPKGPQEQT